MKKVLIIGANSAVAGELAQRYAMDGSHLFLAARNVEKLDQLKSRLGQSVVGTIAVDFNNTEQAELLIDSANSALGHIDLAIIAHGFLGDQLLSEDDLEHSLEIIHTNYTSIVAQLIPLTRAMKQQGTGKIAVLLSVAGDRGRPRNFTYGSAKGALAIYLQGLRSVAYNTGLEIYSFKLGPIDTPMTVDHEKNFSFTTTTHVADKIQTALTKKRYVCYIPSFWFWVMLIVRNLPEFIFQKLGFLSER